MILFAANLSADASQLPKVVKDYLVSQKKVPNVRFDGVVTYNNQVMYLPIYPSYPKEVEELKIVKTYPENQTMDNLPDMVLFNNNFASSIPNSFICVYSGINTDITALLIFKYFCATSYKSDFFKPSTIFK